MADTIDDDDLPESLSFSAGKSQAVKQFQQSVKDIASRKRLKVLSVKRIQERNIQQKTEKVQRLKNNPNFYPDEDISNLRQRSTDRTLETENTVFKISTLDNHVEKTKIIAEEANKFRQKQLFSRRNPRETSKTWVNKRLKRKIARKQST